ncbi:MAG: tetratricopeptide repeat protein, partial [Nannocystaceae bacterium]
MAFSKPRAHERAERFAAKGQHDRAAREYQTIVEHDPKDIRAWLMLADCLVRCGDRPGAIERYERVAKYYVEAREDNKALAVYRQVL